MGRDLRATGRKSLFLGWPMIALTFCLAIITQGFGIYHFSMIKSLISETIVASSTEVAFAYSFYALAMAFAGLFIGDVISKIGIRKVLFVSAVLYSGGFLLLSITNSLFMLYVTYIVMGIGSACGGVVIITGIPSNWFVKHRGTANGIIWSATFVGSLFVTNFIAAITANGSWQEAVRYMAIIAFVVILVVSFFIVWRPQDKGLYPDNLTAEEAAAESERAGSAMVVGLSRNQAVRTISFWALAVAIFLTGIGEMGVFQNLATFIVKNIAHAIEPSESPLAIAATFMSLIGLIGFFGKNLGGMCLDKLGARKTYLIIEIIAAIGLIMLAFAGSNPGAFYIYVAIAFFGIGENAAIVCFSACTGKYLGVKNYAQIFGLVFLAKALGDAVGSPLISALAESTLGWCGAFVIAAVACIVSALIFMIAKKEPALLVLEKDAAEKIHQKQQLETSSSNVLDQ